jgi:hypothetical protein
MSDSYTRFDNNSKNILARQLDYDGPWRIEVNHGNGYINHENGEVILRDLYSACYFHEGKALAQKSEGNYFTVDDRGNFIERHEDLRTCYLREYFSSASSRTINVGKVFSNLVLRMIVVMSIVRPERSYRPVG